MFVQLKKSAGIQYIYIIESYRKPNGKSAHRTIRKMGRLDDFIRDDPLALEKLREEVRRNSNELRNFSAIHAVSSIKNVVRFSQARSYTEGFPCLNYSNYVLRLIWTDILKLEYRFNYLQKQYLESLGFSLSKAVFFQVVSESLRLSEMSEASGFEYALIGDDINVKKARGVRTQALTVLSRNAVRIVPFVTNRLHELTGGEFFIPATPGALKANSENEILDNLISLPEKCRRHEADSPPPFNSEELNFGYFVLKVLTVAVLRTLRDTLQARGLNCSYDHILYCLRQANLLVHYSPLSDAPLLYLKANNGKTAQDINRILTAMELSPLLNAQDRVELARRLRAKFRSDSDIVPEEIFAKISLRRQGS